MESKIASLTWSSKGTKLLTTDISGTINIWKENAMGGIQQKPYITLTIGSSITCAILIHIVVKDQQHMDISSLAKAAVKGDEKALELLSFKKTSDLCPASVELCESSTFLVGLDDGRILRVSSEATSTSNTAETGLNRLTTLASCEGGVLSLLCHSDAGFLIVITDKAMLYHYQLTPPNGATLKEITKMKLAVGLSGPPSLTWAGDCVLAMATGEPVVRLWDVEHADNYTLVPNLSDCDGHYRTVKVLQVAYSSKHQILAAGLNNGMVAFWQHGEELCTHCDLAKMLQSDPTWRGHPSHADEFGSFDNENGFSSSRPINVEYTAHETHRPHSQDKGPEAKWHPQPTSILCSKPEEGLTTGLSELSHQVKLLSWDGSEDRLAIAVSARQPNSQANFNHGTLSGKD
ncbi:intraflagellar transport protein 140 [Paragonimus westermani]|uniref:Intraflagellar transport protein 140 n=1 Tax=Paragonimus westermani TaxID=34504 RepID=A0A5J4NNQ9_9TREM|nr:intraflagellar transport protein 140 [Paragonimus westermani]